MPQDALNPIVQRMIDAGESEENIATVIKHYKSNSDAGPSPSALDMVSGRVGRDRALSEGPEEPNVLSGGLHDMLQSVAHPQSAADFLPLLIPAGVQTAITAGKAYGSAAMEAMGAEGATLKRLPGRIVGVLRQRVRDAETGIARGADQYQMARQPTVVDRAPRASQVIGEAGPTEVAVDRYKPNVGSTADGGSRNTTLRTGADTPIEVDRYMPNTGGAPASPMPATTARVPYAGAPEAMPARQASSSAAAASLSDLELARQEVAAGRLPKSVLEAMERAQAPQPIGGQLRMAAPTAQPPIHVDAASLPESWRPLAEQPPSPLQQPRVQVGAEKVGRGAGLTKEQVRQQTAPILGELPGEASPILPEGALKRIIDTLKELPKGGPEREAYVARATSGKTQWQVENIRRTLEHLGLLVAAPVAGGAMLRDAIMNRLTNGYSPTQGTR